MSPQQPLDDFIQTCMTKPQAVLEISDRESSVIRRPLRADDGVRQADWLQDRVAIEEFRYNIYVAEQGKEFPWVDHAQKRLPDPLDTEADHFVVEGRDGIDGYARLHVNNVPNSVQDYLRLDKLLADPEIKASYLSKVMLSSSRRGGLAFSSLTRFMYRHARLLHCNLFFCHANERLAHLYQGFGWRPYTDLVDVPHMDPQMPLVLMPGDRLLLSTSRPLLYDVEMTLEPAPTFWSTVHREFGSLAIAPV